MRKHTAMIDTPDDTTVVTGPLIAKPVSASAIASGGWRSLRPRGA